MAPFFLLAASAPLTKGHQVFTLRTRRFPPCDAAYSRASRGERPCKRVNGNMHRSGSGEVARRHSEGAVRTPHRACMPEKSRLARADPVRKDSPAKTKARARLNQGRRSGQERRPSEWNRRGAWVTGHRWRRSQRNRFTLPQSVVEHRALPLIIVFHVVPIITYHGSRTTSFRYRWKV